MWARCHPGGPALKGIGGQIIAAEHDFLFADHLLTEDVGLSGQHHLAAVDQDHLIAEAFHTGISWADNRGPIRRQSRTASMMRRH